jgi:hypothetical protein
VQLGLGMAVAGCLECGLVTSRHVLPFWSLLHVLSILLFSFVASAQAGRGGRVAGPARAVWFTR